MYSDIFFDYRVKRYVAGGGDTHRRRKLRQIFHHEHNVKMGRVVPDNVFWQGKYYYLMTN